MSRKSILGGIFVLLVAFAFGIGKPALADTFTLANDNGGDGYVTTFPGGFSLFGADNSVGANTTTYTAAALTNETVTINWSYKTFDCCGSQWDPAGYIFNGVETQLSTNSGTGGQIDSSGSFVLSLLAGNTYGMYVHSVDSIEGRGEITVGATPLPAALPLFAGGLGLVGLLARRRKRQGATAVAA